MTDEQITAALKEVGAEWLIDPSAEHCQARAICHVVDAAVAAERERCARLCEQYADDADEWRPPDKTRGEAVREVARRIRGA